MLRLLSIITAALAILASTTYAEEKFEYIECGSGYHMPLHGESNLPYVTNFHQRGVIKSNSENKFLDKATYYLEGIQVGSELNDIRLGKREKGNGRYEIIIMDEDGDMILGYETAKGETLSGKFTHGTGKYKGITGEYVAANLDQAPEELQSLLKEHLDMMPPIDTGYRKETRSYEICKTVMGTYHLQSDK